ncbi:hypothetical protein ACF05T_26335 [Streptomyces lateritius]|uniref:Uncharacterized protein n=1 Tax=Streptomyces lateritius TaxID=67313 RepID=A0ABW6YIB0_9ACTN
MDRPTGKPEPSPQGAGSGAVRFRPGDVVMLECPFTEVTVTAVNRYHVSVRWPWSQVDPLAESYCWNGDMALPTPEDQDWDRLYFRTEPMAGALKAGDHCLVGIAPTVVHVVATHHFDPPLITGMLPRPTSYVEVLPQGEDYDPELEDQTFTFDPAGGEPIRLDLIFRPYAFLEAGDVVADCHGYAWRFDAVWDWHSLDGGRTVAPDWPLAQLNRDDRPPTSGDATSVARATAAGSHVEEVRRWTKLTLAKPAIQQR